MWRILRVFLSLLAVSVTGTLMTTSVAAQDCGGISCDSGIAPLIRFWRDDPTGSSSSPAQVYNSFTTAQSPAWFEVTVCDDNPIPQGSLSMTVNGSSYPFFNQTMVYLRSQHGCQTYNNQEYLAGNNNEMPWTAGANVVSVTACDLWGNCATETITVTFDSGPPTVSITPGSGTHAASTIPVSVQWQDAGGIRERALGVRVNDDALIDFPYTVTARDAAGNPTAVSTSLNVSLKSGKNTVLAEAIDVAGNAGSTLVTYDNRISVISTEPHHSEFRDVSQGAANVSYGMPSYVSLDAERAASLFYSSGQLHPKVFIQLDAVDNTATPPATFSLKVKRGENLSGWETFTTGSQELFFVAGTGATRLAGAIDARHLPSRAYGYIAEVTSFYNDGSTKTSQVRIRVPVVNEWDSPFGRGWSMPGLQRLYNQGDGVFVTQGDGTAVWFALKDGDGNYYSPDGDFTRMYFTSRDESTGTPAHFWRWYPDKSAAFFFGEPGQVNYGRLNYVTDRFGNSTSYHYDAQGRLERIVDPVGQATTFGYNAEGVLAWMQDPMGRRTTTTTSGGYLWRLFDPDGSLAVDLHFDAGGLKQRWEKGADRNVPGSGWDYGYDAHGKLASVTAPQVQTTDAGTTRPVSTIRSLESAVLPTAGAGTLANRAPRLVPDQIRVESTDPAGATTRIAVDRYGLPTRIEAPLSPVEEIFRNRQGQVVRTKGAADRNALYPSSAGTFYKWSGPNLLEVAERHKGTTEGPTVAYEYEPGFNQVTRVSGSLGEVRFVYGTRGELLRREVGSGSSLRATTYTYDTRGRLRTATAADSAVTTTEYEPSGLQNTAAVVDFRGGRTQVARDAFGRVSSVTDPRGKVVSTTYNALNQPRELTNPAGGVTRYGYHTIGTLQSVQDPRGQTFQFVPNATGWVTSDVDPRGGTTRFGYDRTGNLTTVTNRRGQTVTQTYDVLGRPLSRVADGRTTTFAYDPGGLWIAVNSSESSDTIRYDVNGREASRVTTRAGRRFEFRTTYDDTRGGLRTKVELVAPYTRSIGYEYGPSRELSGIVGFDGRTTSITYNPIGQPTSIRLPTGLQMSLGYSAEHRPEHLTYPNNSTVNAAEGRTYTYDVDGRIAERRKQMGDSVRAFQYDALGQLSGFKDVHDWEETWEDCYEDPWDPQYTICDERSIAHSDTLQRVAYGWDAVGNPMDRGAVVETGNRLTQLNGYTLRYDLDGNLVRRIKAGVANDSLIWNSLGQLAEVRDFHHGRTVAFGYDGLGQRIRKTVNGVNSWYLHDGPNLLMELDAAGNPTREYTYYPGVDRPHSLRQGGQTYYYLTELPGHVTGLVNGSNRLVNQYRYTPFGTLEAIREEVPQPLRYTAREFDTETGLYFHRARYYDPQVGRFISEDPIGLEGGLNLYGYAGNDPVSYKDPTGLYRAPERWCFADAWISGGGLVVQGYGCFWVYYHDSGGDPYAPFGGLVAGINEGWIDPETVIDLNNLPTGPATEGVVSEDILWDVADLGVGFVPGLSTAHDAATFIGGYNVVTGESVGWGGRGAAFLGMVTPLSGPAIRGLWKITAEGTSRVLRHSKLGTFSKHATTGLWWSKDQAGHGKSVWKVFREEADGLHWRADADEYGDFIRGKHKGPTGLHIPFKDLNGRE